MKDIRVKWATIFGVAAGAAFAGFILALIYAPDLLLAAYIIAVVGGGWAFIGWHYGAERASMEDQT